MIPHSDSAPVSADVPRIPSSLSTWRSGLRAALLMPVKLTQMQVGWNQFVVVVLAMLAMQLLTDLAMVGFSGEFVLAGLSGAMLATCLLLFVAWVVANIGSAPEKTLPIAGMFGVLSLFFLALLSILDWFADQPIRIAPWLATWVVNKTAISGWFAMACAVVAWRFIGAPGWRAVSACVFTFFILFVAAIDAFSGNQLWRAPYDPAENEAWWQQRFVLGQEDVFYQQPIQLEAALDAVEPSRGKDINLYFVGAAGFAGQDVFMKEVKYVSGLFARRFDTAGHSINLINNTGKAAEFPIASVTSLGLALDRVGETMDVNKDVLFLFLTSHGSKEHVFSLEFGEFRFNELNPAQLRQLLDESGIRHRVIVVSACYSGGFIDALKEPNTVVMTSAAADKTSFGCSNEAEFTYFGKAYFEQALGKTDSFIDAFELAKPLIAAREKQENFEPSEPAIFIGEKIRPVLAEFSKQQAAARRARLPSK
jgi:hypothetical protein